jgi:inosine-uridine nucleoside N-ribohydrolase
LVVVSALSVVVSACVSSSADTTTPSGVEPAPSATTVTDDSSGPTLVIVDYSPTVSDVGGLMYLLAHPDVEVIAISLPVTGEAGCDLGSEVTLGILAMFGQEEIPVTCGAKTPGHARSWPSEFLEGRENLSLGLPVSTVSLSDERASDMIARTAKQAGRPVVIYAVAPLTNVARAFDDHPDLADDVDRIVIMGGAVNVPGNVEGANAEWNVWVDVPAAAAVISSGVPVTLVPLDATNFVPIPAWYQRALSEAKQSNAIVYLERMVGLFSAVTSGFYFMWDELAASVAAGETYTTTKEMSIVVAEGGPDDGKTTSSGGNPVTVAITVENPDAFYADFLSTLAGSPVKVGSTSAFVEADPAIAQEMILAVFDQNDAAIEAVPFNSNQPQEEATTYREFSLALNGELIAASCEVTDTWSVSCALSASDDLSLALGPDSYEEEWVASFDSGGITRIVRTLTEGDEAFFEWAFGTYPGICDSPAVCALALLDLVDEYKQLP